MNQGQQRMDPTIDRGVNYLDTGETRNHNGESEPFLGRALSGGNPAKKCISQQNSPCGRCIPGTTWIVSLMSSLPSNTDHIDFYLLHGLGRTSWINMVNLNVGEFLDQAIADGRIRYAWFSRSTMFKDRRLKRSWMTTPGRLPRSRTITWTKVTRQAPKG